MVNPNKGTQGTREIKTDYPFTSGLGADDKHEGRQIALISEDGTHSYQAKERVGLNE